ncbi:MAG: pyridoxal-phosphate-dependent aminotransferase family protein [Candidatus Binatia bacterium]
MLKRYLLAPGPTPVPTEVLLAMASPVIHHRTPEFSGIFRAAADGARRLFGTVEPVMMLASTGTGGMEAAVTNTLNAGDQVIVVNGGKFGERWIEICNGYGLEVISVDVEWGSAVDPEAVAKLLDANPGVRAVLLQASETSTTVLHPVGEITKLTRDRDCLAIVDGITSVGVVDMPMDTTGIDVLVTGSQKAMMLPPGLALVALSPKAWDFNATSTLPRYYFDLAKERDNLENDTSAYTPAVALITGFKAVCDLIERGGGLEEVYRRHGILARATRAGLRALGLSLLAPESPSPAATGVWVPEGVDGGALTRHLRDVMGVTVAGGQGRLKGKIVRLAHIGYADTFDVVTGLSALEMALHRLGASVEFGSGVAAAQEVLVEMYG